MVTAEVALDRYPPFVQAGRIEIQWYTNGDYNFHYVETHTAGEVWQCRWDRHPNPHASRAHFDPPPDAASAAAVDDAGDRHPATMTTRALANVRDRIADLWAADS